ncbi:hypothetical protein QP236_07870, partial [Alloscardovia omnicolens]|nr:hypothetical protein [Alloscardovia omnicolens]
MQNVDTLGYGEQGTSVESDNASIFSLREVTDHSVRVIVRFTSSIGVMIISGNSKTGEFDTAGTAVPDTANGCFFLKFCYGFFEGLLPDLVKLGTF